MHSLSDGKIRHGSLENTLLHATCDPQPPLSEIHDVYLKETKEQISLLNYLETASLVCVGMHFFVSPVLLIYTDLHLGNIYYRVACHAC